MDELAPGLWHWQAPHPDWDARQPWPEWVSSHAIELDGELIAALQALLG